MAYKKVIHKYTFTILKAKRKCCFLYDFSKCEIIWIRNNAYMWLGNVYMFDTYKLLYFFRNYIIIYIYTQTHIHNIYKII